ncbi:MAG: uncharacterized protein QG670_2585 [Thermoproteota archaeon]|nr:uncharacterized protein [Thermoproteota archaeon]
MSFIESAVIVIGLFVFKIVNGIDNAVINAHVLGTMGKLWLRRFLVFGVFSSVFLKFILPLLILWLSISILRIADLFLAFVGENELAAKSIKEQEPLILVSRVYFFYTFTHTGFPLRRKILFLWSDF